MRLTEKQQQRIVRHLRDVAAGMENVPRETRERVLAGINERIEGELKNLAAASATDQQLEDLLRRCGSPKKPAVTQKPAERTFPGRDSGFVLAQEDRKWLGVCGGIARHIKFDPGVVRTVVFVAGLVTGPVALSAYILAYFVMYALTNIDEEQSIHKWHFFTTVFTIVATAIGLFLFGQAALAAVYFAQFKFLTQTEETLGEWNWLQDGGGSLFTWALFFGIPLAMLGGLPLANNWDKTLKKVAQAVMALYAVAVCFGIASAIVGVILQVVERYTT